MRASLLLPVLGLLCACSNSPPPEPSVNVPVENPLGIPGTRLPAELKPPSAPGLPAALKPPGR